MSTRAKPHVNSGYSAGQHEIPLDEAERAAGPMTPHEKGEFRKAYWKGRISWVTSDIGGCLRYMGLDDLRTLFERLNSAFFDTLVDMYGYEGAVEFVKNTRPAYAVTLPPRSAPDAAR